MGRGGRIAWLAASLTVAACSSPAGAPLVAPGGEARGAIDPGGQRRYRVPARAGELLRASVTPPELELVWRAPGGAELARAPGSATVIADRDGSYGLLVTGAGAAVSYTVVVDPARAATTDDRTRAAADGALAEAERLIGGDAPDYAGAAAAAERAAAAYAALGDDPRRAAAAILQGQIASGRGDHPAALQHYLDAVTLAQARGDRAAELRVLLGVAAEQIQLGDADVARGTLERSLAVAIELGDRESQATVLNNLGSWYRDRDEFAAALATFQRGLAVASPAGDARAALEFNLGAIYLRLGDAEPALAHFEASMEGAVGPGWEGHRAYVLVGIGRVRLDLQHDPAGAARAIEEALAIRRAQQDADGQIAALIALGAVELAAGAPARARDRFEEALAIEAGGAGPYFAPQVQCGLGDARLAMGDVSAAAAAYQYCGAIAKERGSQLLQARGLSGWALATAAGGDLAGAGAAADRAVELVEKVRAGVPRNETRSTYLGVVRRIYEVAASLHVQAGDLDGGFVTSERAHARALLEALAGPAQSEPDETAIDVAGARALLDHDTVLLEYLLGDDHAYLWVVTPRGAAVHELADRARIEHLAGELVTAMTARNQVIDGEEPAARRERIAAADVEASATAGALYELVLAPAGEAIADKRLAIVADGALHLIPFAALRLPDGRPLLERSEIVALPSATVLASLRRRDRGRSAGGRGVAVWADPVFDAADPRVTGAAAPAGPKAPGAPPPAVDAAASVVALRAASAAGLRGLSRLPSTRGEAELIEKLARSRGATVMVDFAASRESLLGGGPAAGASILHIATHAVAGDDPALSGFVLSMVDEAGRPRDGFVRLQDLRRLSLTADLAVLSACQTAVGANLRGEGLVGLARAFMGAGAERVVASLWQIDDVATAELMARFYRALLLSGARPAAALRAAQLERVASDRWSAPYYWAAFTQYGDWR